MNLNKALIAIALAAAVEACKNQPKEKPMHPLRKYFEYAHLPPHLQAVSKPFGELAEKLDETLPDGDEKSVAFRKLLESKDAAVRAALG